MSHTKGNMEIRQRGIMYELYVGDYKVAGTIYRKANAERIVKLWNEAIKKVIE